MTDPVQAPPVSPTGQPMLSPKLAPYLFVLTTLCTLLAGASQLELGLPPKVFGWAVLGAGFFGALLGATPGLRKAVPMVLLVLSLGLSSCATTSAAPGVAGAAMGVKTTGQLFMATAAVLDSAFDAHLISELQYAPWRVFAIRFQAAYAIADKTTEAALKSGDSSVQGVIEAELDEYRKELGNFQALAAQIQHPDGGAP